MTIAREYEVAWGVTPGVQDSSRCNPLREPLAKKEGRAEIDAHAAEVKRERCAKRNCGPLYIRNSFSIE